MWQIQSGGGLEAQMPTGGRRNAAQQHTLADGALCGGPIVRETRVAAVRQRQPTQRLACLLYDPLSTTDSASDVCALRCQLMPLNCAAC